MLTGFAVWAIYGVYLFLTDPDWFLLLTGFAVWAIYGVYLFLTDPDLMTFENLSAGAIVVGLALLLISVLRQRLLELPHDRYRGVKK